MYKWLHPYANPQNSYRLSCTLLPWFATLAILFIIVGTVWGLAFAPADYQQGDSFRIFYIHVPAASLSMGAYVGMAIAAISSLVWQFKQADASAAAIAPVGAMFTAVALFTGAVWGKPMWGAWWVWDARLTSELILLFLYLGVMALHNAFDDKHLGSRAAAILTLVGVINLPVIHYSVEWWNTLHQGATVMKLGKPSMATNMLLPFFLNFIGFICLLGALVLMRFKTQLLLQNSSRPWVKEMLDLDEERHDAV